MGSRLPVGGGILTNEPNPYRAKLLEKNKNEPSLLFAVGNTKWKDLTRSEKAAQVYGAGLGAIIGLSLFWAGWWGVKFLWPLIF